MKSKKRLMGEYSVHNYDSKEPTDFLSLKILVSMF